MPHISTITYTGELHTVNRHLKSGREFETDAPPDNNGKGEAFSPTDTMSTALGACAVTVMCIKSREMGYDLHGIRIEVEKEMAGPPRRVSAIRLAFHIPHNPSDRDKKVLEATARGCPVARSLHPELEQEMTFFWGE